MKSKKLLSWLVIATMIFSLGVTSVSAEVTVISKDVTRDAITITFSETIAEGSRGTVTLNEVGGGAVAVAPSFADNVLTVTPTAKLDTAKYYILSLVNVGGLTKEYKISFTNHFEDKFEDYDEVTKTLASIYTESPIGWGSNNFNSLTSTDVYSVDGHGTTGNHALKITGKSGANAISKKINFDTTVGFDIITEMNVSAGFSSSYTYFLDVYLTPGVASSGYMRFWHNDPAATGMGYAVVSGTVFSDSSINTSSNLPGSADIRDFNLKYRVEYDVNDNNAIFSAYINNIQIAAAENSYTGYATNGFYPVVLSIPGAGPTTYIDDILIYSASIEELLEIAPPNVTFTDFAVGGNVTCSIANIDTLDDIYDITYQWCRIDEYSPTVENVWETITNATLATYLLTSDDVDTNDGLGKYIICKVKLTDKSDSDFYRLAESNVIHKPIAPVAIDPELVYSKNEDTGIETLTMNYTYFDANDDFKTSETFVWEESITGEDGTWTLISETSQVYTIIHDTDINKYIRCTLTVENNISETSTPVTKVYTMPFRPEDDDGIVTISSSTSNGIETLTASGFVYYDQNDFEKSENNEGNSERQWYRVTIDSLGNVIGRTAIRGANGTAYEINKSNDGGYGIQFGYTPVSKVYPEKGEEVFSNIITIPVASGNSGNDGSVGGGYTGSFGVGGSGSITVSKPAPKEEIVKVPEQTKIDIGNVFSDMKNHWSKEYVSFLYERNLVNGRGNGYYPDDNLTRAEWVTMLLRSIGKDGQGSYDNCFPDINANDWYAKDIQTAFLLGIIEGSDNGFMPNDDITREQVAKIAMDTYEYVKGEIEYKGDLSKFTDSEDVSEWAINQMGKAVKLGVITGMPDNSLSPKIRATRGEAAAILSRVYNLIMSN